jgi:hypothetical protein
MEDLKKRRNKIVLTKVESIKLTTNGTLYTYMFITNAQNNYLMEHIHKNLMKLGGSLGKVPQIY